MTTSTILTAFGEFSSGSITKADTDTVGTSWTQVVDAVSATSSKKRLVELTNMDADNTVFFGVTAAGGSNPSYDGWPLLPLTSKVFPLRGNCELHIKASDAGTSYNVSVKSS